MAASGLAKRASTWEAWAETGVRARRLMGRRERGSADVGIDSGMGSDIFGCFGEADCVVEVVEAAIKKGDAGAVTRGSTCDVTSEDYAHLALTSFG